MKLLRASMENICYAKPCNRWAEEEKIFHANC